MASPDKESFVKVWPRCFVIFLGIIQLICVIVLIITELGNIAANFWITNVFAGGWCGIIMIAHCIALFVAGCCAPNPAAAFRAIVITIIALVACGALIGFDAYFIAVPSACLLTPSCSSYSNQTTSFNYNFQQSFYSAFNGLSAFKNYTQSQTKFLFQTIQLSVGCLCFILCIVFLIIYYVSRNKASKQVSPISNTYNSPKENRSRQPQRKAQQAHAPQPAPSQVQRNPNKRY